jgi:hypothetical protein
VTDGRATSNRVPTPLERFIAATSDDERLALGLDVLRAAYDEAGFGWQVQINEYIYALETGKGLNRPL